FPFNPPTNNIGWGLEQEEYLQHIEYQRPHEPRYEEAVALLEAAGFSTDNTVQFELQGRDDSGQRHLDQLAQAQYPANSGGIVQPTLALLDSANSNRIRAERDFLVVHAGEQMGYAPHFALENNFMTGGGRNFGGFS